jgi:S-phase genomic integrity recombination mediator, N-terminal
MLANFRTALSSLDALQTFTTLSTGHSPKGNECLAASHHLVHGNLEWRWLLLTLQLRICQAAKKEFGQTLRGGPFETELELFVYDLVCMSMCKYNKKHQAELMMSTPFGCGCVKEMWLLVVQLVGRLSEMNELNGFWALFNKITDDIRAGRSTYARLAETSVSMKVMLRKSSPMSCKTPIHFSIWLLCGVAPLFSLTETGEPEAAQQFPKFGGDSTRENQEFLNDLLSSYLKTEPSEEMLRALLYTLFAVLDRWSPRPDAIMLLWEHFHKRLNSNFFVAGAPLASLATVSDTARGYIDQAEQIMAATPNPNHSSYAMFVRALGRMMLRFIQSSQRQQVQKMLGRIYSKFPAAKLAALSESGIHNLVTLFVTIALAGDLAEIGPKIMDLLLQIPLDNIAPARQVAVTKAHVAMLLLYHRKQCDMTDYASKFLAQLKNSGEKPEIGACLKILAAGVNEVFADHHAYFEHGQHLLMDSWLPRFLVQSSQAEQDRLLTTVNTILIRLRETPAPSANDLALAQSIYTFVLPHVKQVFVQGSSSLVVPELAANLSLCATGREGLPMFTELYRFFIEASCGKVLNTSKFLIHILSHEQRPPIDDTVIIQNWIKCLLMQADGDTMDTTRLTAAVVGLEEFKRMYEGDEAAFLTSKDPLRLFFMEIGKKFSVTVSFF